VDRVGVQGDVVMADQVVRGAIDHRPDLVDGGAEAEILLAQPHIGGGEHCGHPGGQFLLGPCIQYQYGQFPVVL